MEEEFHTQLTLAEEAYDQLQMEKEIINYEKVSNLHELIGLKALRIKRNYLKNLNTNPEISKFNNVYYYV